MLMRLTVLVRRLVRITPRESCGNPMSTADFTETYWKLTTLRGESVAVPANQREPHLIFHAAEGRITGSGGCNRISGTYTLDGSSLEIGRVVST
jgi:heat shock protein HslJ